MFTNKWKNIDYAKETLYEKYIRYEVKTKEGNYGNPDTVCEMSVGAGTVIDISQYHIVTLYVYDEMTEEDLEDTSSDDVYWVED